MVLKVSQLALKSIVLVCTLCVSLQTWAEDAVLIAVFDQHERYKSASKSYALSWKLLETAAQYQDVVLDPVESSWQASISRLKGQRVPLVFAAFKTEERQQWARFSMPLAPDNSAIFALPANPVVKQSDIDLKSATVGVSANSVQERFATELGFKNIYSTNERSQLYDMLEEGRLDYLFFGQSMIGFYCLYYANSETRDCMKQVGDPYDFNQVHAIALIGNQDGEDLMQRINRGLVALSSEPDVEQWFIDEGFTAQDYADWRSSIKSHASASTN